VDSRKCFTQYSSPIFFYKYCGIRNGNIGWNFKSKYYCVIINSTHACFAFLWESVLILRLGLHLKYWSVFEHCKKVTPALALRTLPSPCGCCPLFSYFLPSVLSLANEVAARWQHSHSRTRCETSLTRCEHFYIVVVSSNAIQQSELYLMESMRLGH